MGTHKTKKTELNTWNGNWTLYLCRPFVFFEFVYYFLYFIMNCSLEGLDLFFIISTVNKRLMNEWEYKW